MNTVQTSIDSTGKDIALPGAAEPEAHWIEVLRDGTHVVHFITHKSQRCLSRA